MAEAAPTAGAPAGEAQPVAAPGEAGTGEGTGAAVGEAGGLPAAEATGQSGIELGSEAEPQATLPGVMDDGPILATERARDDKGRFAARPEVNLAAPDPKDIKAEVDGVIPEPPPDPNAAAEFTFAGRKYKDQAEAEQRHRSLEGQFKPFAEATEKAATSAKAWKAEHDTVIGQRDALVAELAAVKAAPQQPAAAPTGEEAKAPESINWELYAELSKQYAEQGEPWKANQWLQEQIEATQAKREEALREELSLPQRKAEARRMLGKQTDALFSTLAEYVGADGQPAYPELRDPDKAYAVGKFWTQMGLPPKFATTPQGAIAAIAMYRMATAAQPDATPAAEAQGSPGEAPLTPAQLAAQAAATLEGGRPDPTSSPTPPGMTPAVAKLLTGLRDVELTRPGLGFEA